MNIDRIDHIVITVHDIDLTLDFYSRVMGMDAVQFGEGRHALHFGQQKINLHQAGKEFEPKAIRPTPGASDICFITETPLDAIIERLQANQIPLVDGPVAREGAQGKLMSVYFRDPDDNLIEVANYVQDD